MRGKIDQWKDEKGFGFIVPDDGSERVFFHNSQNKRKAKNIEPPQKNVFDYLLIFVLLVSLI